MDFSVTEILVIALIAFFVFGPEKLPELARNAGRCVAKAKRIWHSLIQEGNNADSSHEK